MTAAAGGDPKVAEQDSGDISRYVWDNRYRYREGDRAVDTDVEATWRRVAGAVAALEPGDAPVWQQRFQHLLSDFRFLPGGRILAGAGTGRQVTLLNCFVMGRLQDSLEGILSGLREGALTMQQGGGIGYDFSTLRPRGTTAAGTGAIASGPVSFMRIWDALCATLLSTGARRGAMMATLRCDHPDIREFVDAKRNPAELRHFNLSVQVTDAFMQAVSRDLPWPLVFADPQARSASPREYARLPARGLWEAVLRAAFDCAEPGVLFIDRINRDNNLRYREHISATNPCGEIPLPPYGACDLGSLNLTRFVRDPFSRRATFDLEALESAAALATRFLDDVLDLSRYPLEAQEREARGSRRIGLGITGLADALIMQCLRYDSAEGRSRAAEALRTICHAAYRQSVELAREKGSFPFFRRDEFLAAPFVQRLPAALREGIASHGVRNSHLIAIAPAGTISLLAGNVSSGIEPVFDFEFGRRVLDAGGGYSRHRVSDHAYRLWRERDGGKAALPEWFQSAADIDPAAQLEMQAALQPHVDNAISKTISVAEDFGFDAFRRLYRQAYDLGLKGCTVFRPNPVTGSVLQAQRGEPGAGQAHCCNIEREAD